MVEFLQAIAVLCFCAYLATTFVGTRVASLMLPSKTMAIFACVIWNPYAVISLRSTAVKDVLLDDGTAKRFLASYSLIFIVLAAVNLIWKLLPHRVDVRAAVCEPLAPRVRLLAGAITGLLCLLYISDTGSRQYLVNTWQYLASSRVLSYNEVRRTIDYGGLYTLLFVRLQFSIVYVLFCLHAWNFLQRRRLIDLLLVSATFLICAISLKKMCFIWFGFSFVFLLLMSLPARYRRICIAFAVPAAIPLLLATTYVLYRWQYADYVQVTNDAIKETLIVRTFLGYPDGFKLYVMLFPDPYPFTYFTESPIIGGLIGRVYSLNHPMELLPLHFGLETTFPAGFAGGAYSASGYLGLLVVTFFLAMYINIYDVLVDTLSAIVPTYSIPIQLSLSASTLWLWTKSFPMSLLTGGNLTNVLFIISLLFFARLKFTRS